MFGLRRPLLEHTKPRVASDYESERVYRLLSAHTQIELTGRADDWAKEAVIRTIIADGTFRTLFLAYHEIKCARFARKRIKQVVVRTICPHGALPFNPKPAIVTFAAHASRR